MMVRVAFHAAAAVVLLFAGHGSASNETSHLQDQEEEDADEEKSFTDSISDFLFDDKCERNEKDVSGLTDLSGWMSTLDPETRLTEYTLPGTHHSAAYDLSATANPNDPEYSKIEDASYNLPDKVIAPLICRFSLTQSLSLSEQLQAGIRYFDLRIDLDSESSTFRAFHVLFGPTIEDLLGQITDFLNEHPKEIVLVEISELFSPAVTEADKEKLRQIILDSFGNKLLPETKDLPTVGKMQKAGTTVLVSVQDDTVADHELLWNDSVFRNTFANTADLGEMISYNTARLTEFEESNGSIPLNKLSWTLTPDQSYIRDSVFSGSLYELAKVANGALEKFAADNEGKRMGNVLLLDYFETSPLFDVLKLSDKSEGEFQPASGAPSAAIANNSYIWVCFLLVLSFI